MNREKNTEYERNGESLVKSGQRMIEVNMTFFKGEAYRSFHKHLCRLSEWKMILETYQQKFGQIWIIQSRAMIFQSSG